MVIGYPTHTVYEPLVREKKKKRNKNSETRHFWRFPASRRTVYTSYPSTTSNPINELIRARERREPVRNFIAEETERFYEKKKKKSEKQQLRCFCVGRPRNVYALPLDFRCSCVNVLTAITNSKNNTVRVQYTTRTRRTKPTR